MRSPALCTIWCDPSPGLLLCDVAFIVSTDGLNFDGHTSTEHGISARGPVPKNIGVVCGKQGKLPDALESFEKALAIEEKTFGREPPPVARTKNK